MSEHARCPFCGGSDLGVYRSPRHHTLGAVQCNDCLACGPAVCCAGQEPAFDARDLLVQRESWRVWTDRPSLPSPAECRDPARRLGAIRPETVEMWLRARGWRRWEHRAGCGGVSWWTPAERMHPVVYVDGWVDGQRDIMLEAAAKAGDEWPGQVLAEMEAIQEGQP